MPSAPAKTENAGRGARLDSWKEIAAYLLWLSQSAVEQHVPTIRITMIGCCRW